MRGNYDNSIESLAKPVRAGLTARKQGKTPYRLSIYFV